MPARIRYGERIGTVVGMGKEWSQLKVVVAFSERGKSPFSGEFIVVEETEGDRRRLVCLVEEPAYGDYSTTESAREKHLVDQYIRDISGVGGELSEEEKRALLFRVYFVRALGELKRIDNEDKIVTTYRFLPELTAKCRYPTEEEYNTILSAGIEDPREVIEIGSLAIGDEVVDTLKVRFDKKKFLTIKRNSAGEIEEVIGRRTAILARTGFGKSNLSKVILYHLGGLNIPVLISDLNGEYAFSSSQGKGLADIPGIRERLVVFTNRKLTGYDEVFIRPLKIDFSKLSPWEVSYLIDSTQELAGVKQFPNIRRDEWQAFVKTRYETATDRYEADRRVDEFIESKGQEIRSPGSRPAVSWRLKILLRELHEKDAPDISQEVLYHLANNLIVIMDLSLVRIEIAQNVLGAVLNRLFDYNKENFTGNRKALIPFITVLEEAQNVLSEKAAGNEGSIFTRYAKEGRKYGLSLVYITQQPGSIDNTILSQTDNYFVMHMLNDEDIKALIKANGHYGGIISRFLQNEALQGNAYIYSAPYQPYVFPVKVDYFDEIVESRSKNAFGENFYASIKEKLEDEFRKGKVKIGRLQYLLAEILGPNHPMIEIDDKGEERINFPFTLLLIEELLPVVGLKGSVEKTENGYVWRGNA
ncbi:MAG: ATP-binding protein [Thermodesulfovibrionales bacterium]